MSTLDKSTWTKEELTKIAKADEVEIASIREDGALRRAVTIWVVRLEDDLYVRSVNGPTGAWYRRAQVRHEGHIKAGGVEKDVTFVEVGDASANDKIDAAYQAKYHRYGDRIVGSIATPQARAATIKLVPR